jgi:N6-adenosine-specific RNA methylase IME4
MVKIMELNNFPTGNYDVIVIDPPWKYKNLFTALNNVKKEWPYKTVDLKYIYELPISSLCHGTSIVFLWTTQKYLFDCKDILQGWGLNYVCCMTWKKTYGKSNGIPMKGFRFNAEFVIVGSVHVMNPMSKKGKSLIPCVFDAPNIGHSIKPDLFYEMVSPLGESRIDLFARRQRDGWDVWGDEI